MSRALFIFSIILTLALSPFLFAKASTETKEGRKVVITSETLTADNKSSTAVFEGTVIATIEDITIYSDKMIVSYDNSEGSIKRIHASGNVRVHRNNSAIFSRDATYLGKEEKIVFTGRPKLVEGENVITGRRIIYFLKDDRAVVEGSRVVLKVRGEKGNALFRDKGD